MQETVKTTFPCRDKISLETLENAGHDGAHGIDPETSRCGTTQAATHCIRPKSLQPATGCLSPMNHSIEGYMRRWLPTYSRTNQRAEVIAHFGTIPVNHPRHQCVGFAVEVIKWRAVLGVLQSIEYRSRSLAAPNQTSAQWKQGEPRRDLGAAYSCHDTVSLTGSDW